MIFTNIFMGVVEIVEFIVFIGIIGAVVYFSIYLTKKTTETWTVNLDANTVLDKAIHGLSKNGFISQTRNETGISLVRDKKPNCVIGGGLLCLCAVPAIVYAIIGGSKEPLVITVKNEGEKTIVTVTGIRAWIKHLKKIL